MLALQPLPRRANTIANVRRLVAKRRHSQQASESQQPLENQRASAKIIFSGIQPTGIPHLGNYLGALKQWKSLQDSAAPDDTLIYSLVDSHAITIQQDPDTLRDQKRRSLAVLLAIGLDPDRCVLFNQSQVAAHAELMWILSCQTSTGKLSRMTQWKEKARDQTKTTLGKDLPNLRLGLFSYPVLQAADILLYQTTHVPVGADQEQHLELARELASAFNHHAGEQILVQPATWISPARRIMNLHKPAIKMSKSDPVEDSRILLTDEDDEIGFKIKRARTDSLPNITYDVQSRPGIANLIDILHACRETGNTSMEKSESERLSEKMELARGFTSPGELKAAVVEAVTGVVKPIRKAFIELYRGSKLDSIADEGAEKARAMANPTLKAVKEAVGLL